MNEVANEARVTPHGFRRCIRCRNTSDVYSLVSKLKGGGGSMTNSCPIENTIPRWSSLGTAPSTLMVSGAVMIRTPRGASYSTSQHSFIARFRAPHISSNEANPFGEDRMSRGAYTLRLATCMKGPSVCRPRSLAPFGLASR